MKRVVVTGLGVVSSIGNNAAEVTQSLKDGKSGIEFMPQYRELGFRSQVAGTLKLDPEALIDRRLMRFMGNGAAYAYLAMKEAIADAGLGDGEISNERTGLVAISYRNIAADDREEGSSATLGIENMTGDDALEYSFNTPALGSPTFGITYLPPH